MSLTLQSIFILNLLLKLAIILIDLTFIGLIGP